GWTSLGWTRSTGRSVRPCWPTAASSPARPSTVDGSRCGRPSPTGRRRPRTLTCWSTWCARSRLRSSNPGYNRAAGAVEGTAEEATMARSVRRARAYRDRLVALLAGAPSRPTQLGWRSWLGALRRTVTEFIADDLNDRAAALTYYGILSIFPG